MVKQYAMLVKKFADKPEDDTDSGQDKLEMESSLAEEGTKIVTPTEFLLLTQRYWQRSVNQQRNGTILSNSFTVGNSFVKLWLCLLLQ